MKTNILILTMALSAFIFQGCEKDDSQLTQNTTNLDENHLKINSYKLDKKIKYNLKSNNDYSYYSNPSNEFVQKLSYLTDSINFSNQTLISEISSNNSLLIVDMAYKGEVNLFKTNNSFVAFRSGEDQYIVIDTINVNNGTKYNYYSESSELGYIYSYDTLATGIDTVFHYDTASAELSPGQKLIIQCVRDHWADVCGDSFFVSLVCSVGCLGCPECCLAISVIWGLDCYNQLYKEEE